MKNNFYLLVLLLAFLLVLPVSSPAEAGIPTAAAGNPDTQNIVFYEIFTGSFSDSNGDGMGDLPGILNRLDYLNDGNPASETSLGIQGIWMTPVFASPSYHKYDVTDYYAVDPDFGTMADLQALVDACHIRGIRLILDLPLNHTSTQHVWFTRFRNARILHNDQNPYYDYYICCTSDEKKPGHAYYPIQGTDFWYEANFSQSMPELNYNNAAVRQAALDIAHFYLDMGVDGFRFDAAKYIYYGDNSRSAAFWQWYTEALRDADPDIWLVAEVWDSDGITDLYYPSMNCFNFTLSQSDGLIADTAGGGNVNRYTSYVEKYLNTISSLRPGAVFVPFISNHDMDRAAGYLPDSNGRIRVAANLYILGPGAPFIYYGEEIGLRGSRGGANTDANRRLAMRWGDEDSVQDPEGSTYDKQTDATVHSMMQQSFSLFHYYRRLIALRREHPEIFRGSYQALNIPDTKLGGFISTWEGSSVLVLHNTTGRDLTLELTDPALQAFTRISGFIGVGSAMLDGRILIVEGQTTVLLR